MDAINFRDPIPPYQPGELVGDKPTYPVNARVEGDFLYVRDSEGNIIQGKQVDN